MPNNNNNIAKNKVNDSYNKKYCNIISNSNKGLHLHIMLQLKLLRQTIAAKATKLTAIVITSAATATTAAVTSTT